MVRVFDNPSMERTATRPSTTLRLAQRSWKLLNADSARSVALAERARTTAGADARARAWAELVLGYNALNLSTPAEALVWLNRAQQQCAELSDRAGVVLAETGIARAWWRQGLFPQAHAQLMRLHDEGLEILRHEQRSVLLNAIAGSYSVAGESDQAFAYMSSALLDTRPSRAPGFEVVLHCNLANELLRLGDAQAALVQVNEGLAACRPLANLRALCALLINRVIALTDLGRAAEALADVHEICAFPDDETGRGRNEACFEILAITALRAGDVALGRRLVQRAALAHHEPIPDEHHQMAQARALLALADGDPSRALEQMAPLRERLFDHANDGLSLRVQGDGLQLLADLHDQQGQLAEALSALRAWQRCQARRTELASRARYQASALQSELARLQRKLREQELRRRQTEQARAELQAINEQLSRKVCEVEQLQDTLREQATRDALTGLYNRHHLNHALPSLFALARRNGHPLALALIDLDHFKSVNDRHGHEAGDRVLAAFGELLRTESRQGDVVCRWGGEEFCLLMPQTSAQAAVHKLLRVLSRWQQQPHVLSGQPVSGLSFSAGVCDSNWPDESGSALLNTADQALLRAKEQGRCRVLVAAGAPG
jgi:diguanylate cyclase (GGDEF)-like protein